MTLLPRIGIQKSFVVKALGVFAGVALSSSAMAAMTLISITGASRTDLTDLTKPKIFAGFAGTCTDGGNLTATCNSCVGDSAGGPKFAPCNANNAYPSLILTIRTQFTGAAGTSPSPYIKIDNNKITSFVQTVESGGNVLVTQLPWGQLCNEMGSDANCTANIPNKELIIGIDTTVNGATTSEVVSVYVNTRHIDATTEGVGWFYTDCNTEAAAANSGFCHFQAYPGDGKIYAEELSIAAEKVATGITGIEYTNLVFFTAADTTGSMSDADIVNTLSNQSNLVTLSVNKAADPPVADNRISGLTNGTRYCAVMANQDTTGIISYYTPLPGTIGGVTTDQICATPSEVIGLLDDKKCFIATAAFGSEMAPEVQSFRDFRNEYLLSNSVGRAFVKTYYKYSPYYARMIAENENAKTIVRAALWPLLLFARMSVEIGLWFSLLIVAGTAALLYEFYRRSILGKRFKGEL